MGCIIRVNLKNENEKIFESESEFDAWLVQNSDKLSKIFKVSEEAKFDKIFSVELAENQTDALKHLDEVSLAYSIAEKLKWKKKKDSSEFSEDLGEYDYIEKVKDSISMTKFIETAGNFRNIRISRVTGINTFDRKQNFIDKLAAEKNSDGSPKYTHEQIEDKWNFEIEKDKYTANAGEDIHNIMEYLAKLESDPTAKFEDIKFNVLSTDDEKMRYLDLCKEVFNKIKRKYPGAKYFPEFNILSKDLPSGMQNAIKDVLGKTANRINGRIDLLVIDKDGKAHVYDWKVSTKEVYDWDEMDNAIINAHGGWHSTKKNKAFSQVGGYGAILEQYGIDTKSAELIPFHMKLDIDPSGGPKGVGAIKGIAYISEDPIMREVTKPTSYARCMLALRDFEYIFSITKPLKISSLKDVSDIMNEIFPDTNISETQIKHKNASIDFYKKQKNFIKEVNKDTQDYKDGYRFIFWRNGILGEANTIVKCKTEKELDEALAKYVDDINESHNREMIFFAQALESVLYAAHGSSGNYINEENYWLAQFTESQQAFLRRKFKKYYAKGSSKWQLTMDENLINQGIFIFKNGHELEIIALSPRDLHYVIPIKKNNNILGFKLKDGAVGTDPINTMINQYGNMLLMKICAILTENRNDFFGSTSSGEKNILNSITVINPWQKTECQAHSNEYLVNNWKMLSILYKTKPLTAFADSDVANSIKSCLYEARDAVRLINDAQSVSIIEDIMKGDFETIDKLKLLLKKLRNVYRDECKDIHSNAGYAYYQIQQALLHVQGIHIYEEPNWGDYFTGGLRPVGTWINNNSQSPSVNARTLQILFARFRDHYTTEFNKVADKFRDLLIDAYKECGFNNAYNSAHNFWRQFYAQDSNGTLDQKFMLKKFDDPVYHGRPKTKELIKYVLIVFNQIKTGQEIYKIEDMLAAGVDEAFEMPLIEAGMIDSVSEVVKNTGVKGAFKGIWQKVKEVGANFDNLYAGGDEIQEDFTKKTSDNEITYNRYLDMPPEFREKLLSNPYAAWETNLEMVFLIPMAMHSIKLASMEYGQYFTAFKAGLTYLNTLGGVNIPNIEKFVEKYVDYNVFLKPIREKSLTALSRMVSTLKNITSTASLGLFNMRPFAREMLVSMYSTCERALTGLIPGITFKDFSEAFWFVIKDAPVSLEAQGFLAALNRRYMMSGYSRTEMADTNRIAQGSIFNMTISDTFIGTKLPDNYYRMAILIAKMKGDGCFEAYSLDPSGELYYDMKKDKRFEVYLSKDPNKDLKVAKEQEQLYLSSLRKWQKIHPELNLKDGDPLPDAYDPDIKQSIRDIANEIYGFFDQEDKSLMTATFLGSAFMQYKTWLSAKLNQHIKKPGFTNIWKKLVMRDENGEELWIVASTPEELNNGMPPIRYLPKSQIQDQWIAEDRALPLIIEEGTYQTGTIDSIGQFVVDVIHWDTDEFRKHWEDPILRGQFIVGLMDTFGMYILIGIINMLFGEEMVTDRASQSWIKQWTYGALMGFAQDGPINKVISSAIGDLNPPAFVTIQQWLETANSVFAGSKSVGEGIVQTFGVTRELRGYFR